MLELVNRLRAGWMLRIYLNHQKTASIRRDLFRVDRSPTAADEKAVHRPRASDVLLISRGGYNTFALYQFIAQAPVDVVRASMYTFPIPSFGGVLIRYDNLRDAARPWIEHEDEMKAVQTRARDVLLFIDPADPANRHPLGIRDLAGIVLAYLEYDASQCPAHNDKIEDD